MASVAFGHLKSGIERFVPEILRAAIDLGLTENERGKRLGGHLCLCRYNGCQGEWTATVFPFGENPSPSRTADFCAEKAFRVIRTEQPLSWLTRDPSKNEWGGAVKVHGMVTLSFSGLPEDTDEALVLALGMKLGLIDLQRARELATMSGNTKFEPLAQGLRLV